MPETTSSGFNTFDRFDMSLCNFYKDMRADVPPLEGPDEPTIVCLCGSSRFHAEYIEWNYRLTMLGYMVLSVGFFPHSQKEVHGQEVGCSEEQKIQLDRLHKHKIKKSDVVFILNPSGYVGESTSGEIDYATSIERPIYYLEPRIRREAPDSGGPDFMTQATTNIYGAGIDGQSRPSETS